MHTIFKHLSGRLLFAVFMFGAVFVLGACKTVNVETRKDPIAVWQGQQSFINKKTAIIIKTRKDWKGLWRRIGKPAPHTFIAGQEIALAVFLGKRPTAGYRVEVSKLRVNEDRARIRWREVKPDPNAMHAQVISSPWAVVMFESVDVPVWIKQIK